MTEPEYRELNAISYSMLSGLSSSPAALISNKQLSGKGISFGSMVDMLLFDGEEPFYDKYCTFDSGIKISDTLRSVIEKVVILNNPFGGNSYPDLKTCNTNIELACKELKYGQTWNPDTRLGKVHAVEKYYLELQRCSSKELVSSEQLELAEQAVNTLAGHQFTKDYFTPQHDGIEIHFQVPIVWEYCGHACKSLLDTLVIDHNLKTWRAVDLKTMSTSVYSFPDSYMKWKYYIQAAFYKEAVIQAVKDNSCFRAENEIKIPSDYLGLAFDFVVISSSNVMRPLVYRKDSVMEEGRDFTYKGEKIKGFISLIEDYEWHLDEGLYDYPREIYEQDGLIHLNIN